MSSSSFLLSIVTGLALAASASAREEPTLEQRLERLSEALEQARSGARVPGMSIAVVKDDALVWARGFGLADVAGGRAADAETVYAIGSATKAFTATLVGMLADEGQLSWDDPVTRHLPYFDLAVRSDDPDAACTLRDLLSHRHGFTRMGILASSGNVSREELLHAAAGAEPWDDFRKGFHYCNVTYLAAGEAAGAAASGTWEALMRERIFEPLGMASSTLSVAEARADPRLALGYGYGDDLEGFEPKKMIDLSLIGPAGAVNSNVLDMAQWLRLQLGRGAVDGKRLITTERLLETWSPQIEIAPGLSYGLGWMLREHDGRKVVEHGGNIDGFSAQVSLVPEENLGYVLLLNQSASPLREASLAIVFDALLDEWPAESVAEGAMEAASASAEEVDFEDYTGVYVANFATFRDEEFEVRINDDGLALDIPSQRTFDLRQPSDDEGRWTFALTDQISVSFQRNDQGAVVGLTVHQGGFHFEVPRKGLTIEPGAAVEELRKYVGTYVRAEGGKRVELFLQRGLLTMEDKGNWVAFHAPDAEGHAPLRARADQGATFEVDAEGNAESFIYHGDAGDKLFTRLADAPQADLPTLDELLALRKTEARIAAMDGDGGVRVRGEAWVAQAGLRGTLTMYTLGRDRYANHMDFGKFGRISGAARGGEAWSYDSMRGLRMLKGDELAQALLDHPGAVEGDWNEYFDSVTVLQNDSLNDRPVHVVRLQKEGLTSRRYWVDAEHGDVLRVKLTAQEGPVRIPVTIDYFDFEELRGIRHPRRVEIENPMSGRMVLTIEEIESGLELGDEVFTLEVADGEEAPKR